MEIKEHLPQRSYTKLIGIGAALFGASALVHLSVAIARGWDWAGSVSFRKPVTFAVSFALLLAALWWILDRLPPRPRLGWGLSLPLVVGSLFETGLITMQSWRGEASHFNIAEDFDAAVFTLMGMTILVVSLAIVGITIWTFVEGPRDRAARLAARSGLVMVVLGLGLGLPLITAGVDFLERTGAVPESIVVGSAGAAKFPHAIAFHGVQFLIAIVIAGARLPGARRHQAVRYGVTAYSLVLAWATLHTNAGRSPVDLAGIETGLLALAILALAGAASRFAIAPRRDTLPA